jgi:hypothetical protein
MNLFDLPANVPWLSLIWLSLTLTMQAPFRQKNRNGHNDSAQPTGTVDLKQA